MPERTRFYDRRTSTSARIAPRPHPGFIQTGWAICLAWLAAGLVLGVTGTLLAYVGLFDLHALDGPTPDSYLRGPFVPHDWWASAADVSIAVVVVVVSAATVQRVLWARSGFAVGTKTVVSTLALTGFVPFLPIDPRIVTGVGALLVATLVLRFFAVEQAEQPRLPLREIGVCVAAAFAISLSYTAFHPLRYGDFGHTAATSIAINNAGFADAALISVSPKDAGIGDGGQLTPVKGATIPARGHVWITFRRDGCPPEVLTVRYRLLGRVHTQAISQGGRCSPPRTG